MAEIKDKLTSKASSNEDNIRTTLSLSITVSDKKALKQIALDNNTTIAAIIHQWVQEYIQEGEI